jgi:hypothetical protein
MRSVPLLAIALAALTLSGCLRPGESLAAGDARVDATVPDGVTAVQVRVEARRLASEGGSLDIVVRDDKGETLAQQGFDVTQTENRTVNVDTTTHKHLVVEARTTRGVLAYDLFVTSMPMPGSNGFALGEAHVSPLVARTVTAPPDGTLP